MAIFGLFDIGRTTIVTNRNALSVVGHNIANASTPGYTRQSVSLASVPAGDVVGATATGRGVKIADVTRMYDAFTTLQIRSEKSNLAYWDSYEQGMTKIENIFNEANENGISDAITNFFSSWQSVSQNPEQLASRATLIKNAEYLSSRVSSAYADLDNERYEIFKNTETKINEVNQITKQIADLNQKISVAPNANDLKDQRDDLLEQLNGIVKVSTFEDASGMYSVLVGGTPVIDGGTQFDLRVRTDTQANDYKMIFEINLGGSYHDITQHITGGELKAGVDLRDGKILDYMNKLNALAVNITDTVNFYHKQGYGLDGSTGNDFFTNTTSVTDASVSGSVTSVSITNATTYGANATKQYRLDYIDGAAYALLAPAQQADYQQEGASGIYWRVQGSTDNGTTWSAMNPANVTITADTAATPDNRTFGFNGINIKIDGNQAAIAGDAAGSFDVNINRNAARSMSVAISDTSKVAAAQDNTMLPGDNRNALLMADLANQKFVAGTTPIDFYRSIVSDVGVEANSASKYADFYSTIVEQLENKRQDLSGVSLDEEAADLLKFQKSFQAGAKMITVADELFQTLLGMTGSR
jgi:flagellar hook-associated protein 1 FlgK